MPYRLPERLSSPVGFSAGVAGIGRVIRGNRFETAFFFALHQLQREILSSEKNGKNNYQRLVLASNPQVSLRYFVSAGCLPTRLEFRSLVQP